jgi:hypothetical protein
MSEKPYRKTTSSMRQLARVGTFLNRTNTNPSEKIVAAMEVAAEMKKSPR